MPYIYSCTKYDKVYLEKEKLNFMVDLKCKTNLLSYNFFILLIKGFFISSDLG